MTKPDPYSWRTTVTKKNQLFFYKRPGGTMIHIFNICFHANLRYGLIIQRTDLSPIISVTTERPDASILATDSIFTEFIWRIGEWIIRYQDILWRWTVWCLSSRRIASSSFWRLDSSWAIHDGPKTRPRCILGCLVCQRNNVQLTQSFHHSFHGFSSIKVLILTLKYLQQEFSLCGRKNQDCWDFRGHFGAIYLVLSKTAGKLRPDVKARHCLTGSLWTSRT